MFFEVKCVVCETAGQVLCEACAGRLVPAPKPHPLLGLDDVRALFVYDEICSRAILALKFRNAHTLGKRLAQPMSTLAPKGVDQVTWAPSTRSNSIRRGYDQGEVLARAVARRLGVPCSRLLARGRDKPQGRRSRTERLEGPKLRLRNAPRRSVLIVDDVLTTGSTLSTSAACLKRGGAVWVGALTVAWTPPSRARR